VEGNAGSRLWWRQTQVRRNQCNVRMGGRILQGKVAAEPATVLPQVQYRSPARRLPAGASTVFTSAVAAPTSSV